MIRKVLNEDIAKGSAQAIDYSLYEPDGFAVEFSLTGFAAFSPSNGPCPSFEKWLKFAINLRAYRPWQLPPIEGSIRNAFSRNSQHLHCDKSLAGFTRVMGLNTTGKRSALRRLGSCFDASHGIAFRKRIRLYRPYRIL